MLTSLRRWPLLAVLLALLTLSLGACGDDDEDTETGAGAGDTTTSVDDDRNVTEYCDKILEIETFEPDIDFESLSPEQLQAAVKKAAAEDFKPLVEETRKVVPLEIKADFEVLAAGVDKVAETGDFEALEDDPAFKAAETRAHLFDRENCGWARQNVTGVDYAFNGLSPNVKAGPVSFDLKNDGKEVHELVVVKKKAGVTESFDALIAMSEEEAQEKVDVLGGVEPVPPGESDYVVAELEKGEYLVACFLPVGATPEVLARAEASGERPQGEPHALKGMRNIVTVG